MRRYSLFIALLLLSSAAAGYAKSDQVSQEVKDWCTEKTGQEFWLRTGVIRIQGNYKATDATNVYPDGRIYHQGTIQKGVQISAQTVEEFTAEARRKLGFSKDQNAATVRTMEPGARVLVHGVEATNGQVKVKITLKGSWYAKIKTAVRLKMVDNYTLEDVQRQFALAFARHEYLVKHAYSTNVVSAGMTGEEVIHVLGLPDTKIELGSRVILFYNTLRLVFDDDALSDAQ